MWKSVASNTLTLFLLAMVAVGGVIGWGQREYAGPGPLEQAICLRVAPGDTITRVSTRLEEEGAISDGRIFRIGADYSDKASQLKFGSYIIPAETSMAEILEIVTKGGQSSCGTEVVYRVGVTASEVQLLEVDPASGDDVVLAEFDPTGEVPAEYAALRDARDTRYRIVVAEGTTSWQVVEALKSADFLTGSAGDVPEEGTLAPDSYELRAGSERAALLERMADRQTEILNNAWAERGEDLPFETREEALILASIIEKETGLPDERETVAAVFVNRLRAGMRLQTDPTVIYGITEGKGVLGRGLRRSELRRATPYNTYVIDGLPPGPIANPGRASIEAALNPGESEFLFFVADGTGGHAFAKTLDEHNINVRKWRQIEIDRQNQSSNQ